MGFAPFGEVDEAGLKVVEALFSGYGEGFPQGAGPDQNLIEKQGRTYLDQNFSQLDRINTATIAGGTAPAKAKKKAKK